MPAKAKELETVARKLGFVRTRQRGSHARWKHEDGRATTIPIHGNTEIGGWLFHSILSQLDITQQEFEAILKQK